MKTRQSVVVGRVTTKRHVATVPSSTAIVDPIASGIVGYTPRDEDTS